MKTQKTHEEQFLIENSDYSSFHRFDDCDRSWDIVLVWLTDYASLVSEEKDRRIRELTEALQSVWRLRDFDWLFRLTARSTFKLLNPPKP